METRKEYSDQALRQLFNKLPQEKISPTFNREIMDRILQEKALRQKRNLCIIWSSISLTSLAIIAISFFTFRYLSINLLSYFKGIFSLPNIDWSNWLPYIFIGSAALLLLILDSYIRNFLLKQKFTDHRIVR